MPGLGAHIRAFAANLVLVTVGLMAGFLVVEGGCRAIWWSQGGGDLVNYAVQRTELLRVLTMYQHDSELGWALKPGFVGQGSGRDPRIPRSPADPPFIPQRFTVTPDGLRSNGSSPPSLGSGILVVGDSFAGGSVVSDDETWPAQLERLTSRPVANAGIGGFGVDQIYLSLVRHMDRLRPGLILFSFIDADIDRAELSIFGGAYKPYFQVENGQLILRNVPVPEYRTSPSIVGSLRYLLGWSFAIDRTMAQLGMTALWRTQVMETRGVQSDGQAVGCAIMDELSRLQKKTGTPIIIFPQYTAQWVIAPPPRQAAVLKCAMAAGLHVIDPLPMLTELRQREPDDASFASRWWLQPGDPHHSPAGERLNAQFVHHQLRALGLL